MVTYKGYVFQSVFIKINLGSSREKCCMQNARDVLRVLESSQSFVELLDKDNRTTNEVGCVLTEGGKTRQFKEGDSEKIGFYFPGSGRESTVIVHTHPRIDDGPTPSEKDLSVKDDGNVEGMVVLSRKMFDVEWDGVCMYFGSDNDSEDIQKLRFTVTCDGTTEGSSEDRWVENPHVQVNS